MYCDLNHFYEFGANFGSYNSYFISSKAVTLLVLVLVQSQLQIQLANLHFPWLEVVKDPRHYVMVYVSYVAAR